MTPVRFEIPIRTISEANSSDHWTAKAKRHQQQQFFVRAAFKKHVLGVRLPIKITLTRLSPRKLDAEENLPMAFKWIKDEIGACIFPEKIVTYTAKSGKVRQNKGNTDSDPRVTWAYSQEVSKRYGIRIEIESVLADSSE